MSQNTFNDNAGNTVVIGWDRMLSHYFMNIIDSEGDYTYTSLSEGMDVLPYLSIEYYLNILEKEGITLPEAMIEACIIDKEFNLGNEVRFFDENGLK
jgi:hypothetical protein